MVDFLQCTEEIEKAKARLSRIKVIGGGEESEDTLPLMTKIWVQLVRALLLHKLSNRQSGAAPITFLTTPTISTESIALFARMECGKLNRLALQQGEDVRVFSARCRQEERYCAWLRTMHEPETPDAAQTAASRLVDVDVDSSLFGVLCASSREDAYVFPLL